MYMIAYCIAGNFGGALFSWVNKRTRFFYTRNVRTLCYARQCFQYGMKILLKLLRNTKILPPPPSTITYLTKYTDFQAPTHINFRCSNIQSCILYLRVQPDNNTAQYVLKMMISQHKFYRAELEDTPGLSWLASGVEG